MVISYFFFVKVCYNIRQIFKLNNILNFIIRKKCLFGYIFDIHNTSRKTLCSKSISNKGYKCY